MSRPMNRRLTDAELRAAAARRPGYATYPEYRPGQRERLGQLPAVGLVPARPASAPPVVIRPPVPEPPAAVTLAALPSVAVFDFQPRRIDARPWWRPRWHWGVIAAGGRMDYGYSWTEGGASWCTARAARRVAR